METLWVIVILFYLHAEPLRAEARSFTTETRCQAAFASKHAFYTSIDDLLKTQNLVVELYPCTKVKGPKRADKSNREVQA